MAAPGFVATLRNARLDQITSACGASALLRIYDGTRPATGGAATTLLAELTCNATFAPAASGGVLTLNPITQDSSANATGTASWGRLTTSGGTAQMDFDVTLATANTLQLTTLSITATQPVSCSTFTITEGNP